jgi:uncharacterized SAM-binding protein YcdF (DUF218 family)
MVLFVVAGLGGWGLLAWMVERFGRRPVPAGAVFDAIVVLGCRVMPDGTPSTALDLRIREAVALFHEGRAPRIICTGGVGASPYAESEVCREIAVSLGVPPDAVITEQHSTSTLTNARHAAAVAGPQCRAVLVVTDAFHVLRAARVFARVFGRARGSGTVHPSWRVRVRGALREVGALAAYAALGRL